MSNTVAINNVTPTPFLRSTQSGIQRRFIVELNNQGCASVSGTLTLSSGNITSGPVETEIMPGKSSVDVFLPDMDKTATVSAVYNTGADSSTSSITAPPAKQMSVHIIHRSHHDVGYTDLASNVLAQHCENLAAAIDMAHGSQMLPSEARFRIVIEQSWSLLQFLRTASPQSADAMIELLRSGQFEVTAFFANMTTELCGHEEMYRCLYPAFALKRKYGIPLTSAEHNDIPGISWGMCRALCDAGINMFCPSIPDYYSWGPQGLKMNWDEDTMLGHSLPGAFWWEAQDGSRILTWHNRSGAGGPHHLDLRPLEQRVIDLAQQDYPYTVVRWPISGGGGDNAPYDDVLCTHVAAWNQTWVNPRVRMSTNAELYAELSRNLPHDTPVHRGELPGQDYPPGAMSTSAATVTNRRAQATFSMAEVLASAAKLRRKDYPGRELAMTMEELIWHDEHTWGFHFPCGPGAEAASIEKASHAYKAAALGHDVANKAMARIADEIELVGEGPHLVVFNALPHMRTSPVRFPLRELDNIGASRAPVHQNEDGTRSGPMKLYALGDRWHVVLDDDMIEGRFELVECDSQQTVPFDLVELESPSDPSIHAPDRYGLASGGKRYGFFELPAGLARELCFTAHDIPACGYRTYYLRPTGKARSMPRPTSAAAKAAIENDYYRIQFEDGVGIKSILDKTRDTELVDTTSNIPFGSLVVLDPREGATYVSDAHTLVSHYDGETVSRLTFRTRAHGHPDIECSLILFENINRVDFAVRVLKDPTPLLEVHLAFPFLLSDPKFTYEGCLSTIRVHEDFWPNSCWNRVTVQDWVVVQSGSASLIWSPLDAPVASLGRLWPTYASPAHSCIPPDGSAVEWANAAAMDHGHIYSALFCNNFGTNLRVSQTGSVVFRYTFTSQSPDTRIEDLAVVGQDLHMPLNCILTEHERRRTQPRTVSFMELSPSHIKLCTFKLAEDSQGMIVRIWNQSSADETATVRISDQHISRAMVVSAVEENPGKELECSGNSVCVPLRGHAVVTVRIILT